jgi:amino acid transporter
MADNEQAEIAADEQLLSSLGYKQELRRTLKFFSMFAISFSVISVTTGLFTNFAFATSEFGAASIWLWPVASVGALILSFVLAELASRLPLAGYSYQWGGRLIGPGYGWFVGFNLICAFTLASGGETLFLLSPTVGTIFGLNVDNKTLMIILSVIILLLAGLVNVVGVKLTARINNISVVTEVLGTAVLGILILVAFLVKSPKPHPASFIFSHGPLHGQAPWYAACLALLMGAFTIGGFEASADLGEEAVGVQKTVPRAIIGAVAISGVIGMITLICIALGIPNLKEVASSPTPIADIAKFWFGAAFARVFLVTVAYSVFALMVVQVAAIGRLIFSLSRDNMFPASRFFGRVGGTTKTPVPALVLTTVLYIVVMVYAAFQSSAYVDLIGATPVFASIVYLLVVVAYWLRRDTIPKSKAFDMGKWAPLLFGLSVIWEVFLIVDFTLPAIFHAAAKVAIGGEVVAAIWYLGLRGRIRRGEAGQALSMGKLGIGLAAPAATNPVNPTPATELGDLTTPD